MKTLTLITIGTLLFLSSAAMAQVSVNVNIGSPPPWGPVGYSEVRYYYLPAVESYYDIESSMFIYYSRGVWVHQTHLPGRYRSYDLYNGYKVVMTGYRGNAPYTYFGEHKKKYSRSYRGGTQRTIGDRPKNGNNKERGHSNKKGGHGGGEDKKH